MFKVNSKNTKKIVNLFPRFSGTSCTWFLNTLSNCGHKITAMIVFVGQGRLKIMVLDIEKV